MAHLPCPGLDQCFVEDEDVFRTGTAYADSDSESAHGLRCASDHFDPVLSFHAVGPRVRVVSRARWRFQRVGFVIFRHARPCVEHLVHPARRIESDVRQGRDEATRKVLRIVYVSSIMKTTFCLSALRDFKKEPVSRIQ